MTRRPLLTALPLIAALALSSAAIAQQPGVPTRAQPEPTPTTPTSASAAAREGARPPMPIIDVEFAGGTLQEFVKAVQKAAIESAAKTPVNVMIPSEAANIAIPAISLKRVSADTALSTLQYAFGMQQLHARNMTNQGDEGLTFAIQHFPNRPSPQGPGSPLTSLVPVRSEAYSLGPRGCLRTPGDWHRRSRPARIACRTPVAHRIPAPG